MWKGHFVLAAFSAFIFFTPQQAFGIDPFMIARIIELIERMEDDPKPDVEVVSLRDLDYEIPEESFLICCDSNAELPREISSSLLIDLLRLEPDGCSIFLGIDAPRLQPDEMGIECGIFFEIAF